MWTKHKNAVEIFTFNFGTALDVGESVAGSPSVRVFQRVGTAWVDKTTDFVQGVPVLTGAMLPWLAKAGTTGTQPGNGTYAVHGEVVTSLGRKIVHIEDLKIDDKAAT